MNTKRFLVGAAVALLGSSLAFAGPVVIANGYIEAGVNTVGTLGQGGSTQPGLLYDSTGTGNYVPSGTTANDILTPGTPFEGYYVNYNGTSAGANNASGGAFGTSDPVANAAGTGATWSGGITALNITNTYQESGSVINVTTTLTALTDLTGVEFLRTLDPDPDVYTYDSYNTNNERYTSDWVLASGPDTGLTVGLYYAGPITHNVGVSNGWSTDPNFFLTGSGEGDGWTNFYDATIGLAFNIGDMASGSTETLNYEYVLGGTPETATGTATGGSPIPEPSSLLLLATGLAGIAGAIRRKLA